VEKLKDKREEHKCGIQGVKGELRAHRDKIRAASVAQGDMAEEVKAAAEEHKKQEALTSSLAKQLTRVSTRVRAEGKARATMMAPADAPGCEAHFVLFQWILTAAAQVGHLRAIRSWR
jgi:hypothetical protein